MATQANEHHAAQWSSTGFSRTQIGMTLGAAAAGILIRLAGSIGRKMAVQSASTHNRVWDEVLQIEHRAVETLFQTLLQTEATETGKRTALFAKIKHALIKHAIEEENAIYPALQRIDAIEDGDQLFEDHAAIKKAIYDVDRMDSRDGAYLTRVRELSKLIEQHVQREEGNLFPRLKRAMSDDENKQATARIWKEGLKLA